MPKIKNQKGFVSILVLLIAVSIIGYFSYKSLIQEGDNPKTAGYKQQIDKAEEIAKIAEERARRIENEISGYIDKAQSDKENKINVTLKIVSENNSGEYLKEIDSGNSVSDLIKLISEEEGLSFKYQNSGLGALVEEINGVKNDISSNMYWALYVNGKITPAGISDYKLSDNDIIEWRYESIPESW